jgi:IclR family pca regulon transcriptional regulator
MSADDLATFAAAQDYVRFTEHTPMNGADLSARVTTTRAEGYVISRGFRDPGGSSVAVPVRDHSGKIVACVNLSGPDIGFDFKQMENFYLPETQATALRISRELGYQGA